MNAKDAIQLVVEGRAPQGWTVTEGVYGDHSNWPHSSKYYAKCPKCGLLHGDFKTLRDAHSKKFCPMCSLEQINKLKDEIEKVVTDPEYKPKEMSKIVGEAIELFDPFDTPPEETVPELPDDSPADTHAEIDRLLLSNWVDVALREFSQDENIDFEDLEIDKNWREGDYDPDDPESTTQFKVELGNQEWLFFKDNDTAEAYALEIVRNDLTYEPELFTQDWLKQFVNEDRLRDAIGDHYEDWEDEVRNLDYDELLGKMVDEGYVESDDPTFFDEDGNALESTDASISALDTVMEDFIDKEKPKADPWEWMRDVYGHDASKEAIKMVGFDLEKAAADAVATDGWQHFVNHYDGNSSDLQNGAIYCRIN